MKAIKVIGVGLQKTGTTSLCLALRQLGYKHIGYNLNCCDLYRNGNIDALLDVLDQYDPCDDWPWPLFYQSIYEKFPNSKFILTKRISADVWFESFVTHAKKTSDYRSSRRLEKQIGHKSFRAEIYGYDNPSENRQHHIEFYHRHNKAVSDFFADKPGSLIELCWEKEQGWNNLSGFINEQVPESSIFPHARKRK